MIAAMVVFYYPSVQQEEYWRLLRQQFDKVYFIYNSPRSMSSKTRPWVINCEHIEFDRNMGIGYALDFVKTLSENEGFEWLYTFDQDSSISDDYAMKLFQLPPKVKTEAAIICPVISDRNLKVRNNTKNGYEYVEFVISSGCAINLQLTKLLHFDASLFIDYVDYDFCLKVTNSGRKIVRNNNVILVHSVGEHTSKWGHSTSNHPPIRRYYIFRNRFVLIKKYGLSNTLWAFREFLRYPTELLKIVFIEDQKVSKLMMCLDGIIDGICGKRGVRR